MTPPPAAGGDLVHPAVPPKDPILVLVLNLLVAGGVGYIVIGQKTKGIVAIIAWCLLLLPQGHPVGQWTFFNDHR
jgi:hypothetical protein